MNFTPAEQIAHSTVRIECDLPGECMATGTGFFYSLDRQNNQHKPVIITNKHVVEGANKCRFHLTIQNEKGLPEVGTHQIFEIENFKDFWKPHPDSSIDLCAIPIAPIISEAASKGVSFFFTTLDKGLLPSTTDIDDMMGLESITMVGYPNGLWDQKNNLPIFRQGTLASDYKRDWNGKKEFLIDAACFPGSSGSPVMLFDIGSYQTRKGNFMGTSRIKLLGILYAGPQHTIEGEIKIMPVAIQQKAVAVAAIPNNLGIIIKSELLLSFENLFPN